MSVQGIPVGGLKRVDQIVATNTLTFHAGQNGLAIAVALLSTHTAGAPVVDRDGKYLGFINEFDVMKALEAEKDLSKLTAEDLMRHDRIVVQASTMIAKAAKMMEEHRVLNLPIEKDGRVVECWNSFDFLTMMQQIGLISPPG